MKARMLVVDDTRLNVSMLTEILEKVGHTVFSVNNGSFVMDMVRQVKPDIILLDIVMPGLDGFQVCKLLKADYDFKDIPVIMTTSRTGGEDVQKALELGAFDYIKKPVDECEVIARVQSALRFKQYQDMLKEMAMKDGLTGLYNHSLLIELFEKELARQERRGNGISFIMIDIDYFKMVNDTYGHLAGDVIIKELSGILTDSVRKSDIVGRYGGEEFGIILPEISHEDAYLLCERIRHSVEYRKFHIDGNIVSITISVGLCFKGPLDELTSSEMIKKADEALYRAKRGGRNMVEMHPVKVSV